MGSKGRVIVVTADKYFLQDVGAPLSSFGFEIVPTSTAIQAALKLGDKPVRALILDTSERPETEVDGLVQIHKEKGSFSLFVVKSSALSNPTVSSPLRVLGWPSNQRFLDQVRGTTRPVVFLVDQTLFAAGSVLADFQAAGLGPVVLESPKGLAELLVTLTAPAPPQEPRGLLKTFFSGSGAAAVAEPILSHVVMAMFKDSIMEAEALDARIRTQVPEAVCYYLSSTDPLQAARHSLRANSPVSLTRAQAGLISKLLDAPAQADDEDSAPKPPLLLVETNRAALPPLAQALLGAGHRVEIANDGPQALEMARAAGTYHIVIIGTNFSYAQGTGTEMAGKLREIDSDLRFIFMMDRFPLTQAIQEIARLRDWGADEAMLKPVEPTQLIAAIERAVKRRALEIRQTTKNASPPNQKIPASQESSPAADPAPAAGPTAKLLGGKYELICRVGEGGMGMVYKAYDRNLDRFVAVKKMRPEIKLDPNQRERFISEAKLISRISHPLIVGIHEIVEDSGELYLIFDYVDGKTLSQVIAKGTRFPLQQCKHIFAQVCGALEAAHRMKILHRDIKLSNLMFDSNGFVKVLDFGLARQAKDTVLKLTGMDNSGTLAYMAPEQHMGKTTRASDIYSLGVCLYEMLTCELPFMGPDFLAQKERMKYIPPNFIAAYLPKGIEAFMSSVLDPDPIKRVGTATEFLKRLRAV